MLHSRLVAPVLISAGVIAYASPELNQDRIFPFDDSVYACTGAFFSTMATDFGNFVKAPKEWAWNYYHQYPALALRAHPPIFDIAEGAVYCLTGISVFGAKLTTLLFALLFALGVYYMALGYWHDEIVALGTALLILTPPAVLPLLTAVWLDIPSLAFAAWAFYFYARRLENGPTDRRSLFLLAVFMALSLYTYQLPGYLFAGLFVHLVLNERRTFLRDRGLWLAAGLLFLLLLPQVVFTVYMARDYLSLALGAQREELAEFTPVANILSVEYWIYYARLLLWNYPVPAIGLAAWGLLRFFRRPSSAEVLFFLCFLTTYLGFSVIASKGPRYALYIAFAACPLAVVACRDVLHYLLGARRLRHAGALLAVLLILSLGQAATNSEFLSQYLSGMDKPVQAILDQRADPRILYSGPMDAGFIFYVRQADRHRAARVYRAGVQMKDPRELNDFIKRELIDVLVFEEDDLGMGGETHPGFRSALQAYIENASDFKSAKTFEVLFGQPGKEKPIRLSMHAR
jgi:4-amino-4-deoxy-L-arabinose transferase-like glycosyltransferase